MLCGLVWVVFNFVICLTFGCACRFIFVGVWVLVFELL